MYEGIQDGKVDVDRNRRWTFVTFTLRPKLRNLGEYKFYSSAPELQAVLAQAKWKKKYH